MLCCARLTRSAVFWASTGRRSGDAAAAAAQKTTFRVKAFTDAVSDTVASGDAQHSRADTSLQHAKEESDVPLAHVEKAPQQMPKFLFQSRRGSSSSEYYMTRSNAGHPDTVAELLRAGRTDPEWMWLKLLCFLCVSSTFGTTLYSYFFAEHMKYFKDEPWSPFTY
ncbi:conserved hypothetical protein [Leishmania braziliensis MHOM/BR/75/M2904]|uniref:Uncharacterized protein n=2 Tax=Leishmania braziliensis TaxID=5660 RepID=A4HAR4_LEIBR|nr:conserved hypothetical protein [Leishmania braziliensis MHOM/BR/75/M2904]KAI5686434.1 hypothetical protein MNV84_03048 [Leishmania braziliensis]CAJ2471327.1 unnamed protein product [Leishmania braziliensis]CAJ2471906.1 unnamed protein product [Leishmania braziliensis]CAM38497.1 conserved hypothetical protein [Leishmania braziliensis MHOM/BR/75/M2904]SYZ65194.1 hypothetical_protein [Leishmania braziliensis MHOM/BR/75/M2904]